MRSGLKPETLGREHISAGAIMLAGVASASGCRVIQRHKSVCIGTPTASDEIAHDGLFGIQLAQPSQAGYEVSAGGEHVVEQIDDVGCSFPALVGIEGQGDS